MSHGLTSHMLGACAVAMGLALAACNTTKKAPADTVAAAAAQAGAPSSAAAPTQSLALLAGTWTGRSLMKDRDSVLGTWKFVTSGDTGTVTFANGAKSRVFDIHVVGDTIRSRMPAMKETEGPYKGQMVAGDVATQVHGDSLIGTGVTHLVDKPATITSVVRIQGTRVKK